MERRPEWDVYEPMTQLQEVSYEEPAAEKAKREKEEAVLRERALNRRSETPKRKWTN